MLFLTVLTQISCPPDQLKYLQMDLISRNRIRFAFIPNNICLENLIQSQYPISLKNIIYWPGITLHLNLGKLQISRGILPNYKRSMIIGGHSLQDDKQPNNTLELRRIKSDTSIETCPKLSVEILDTFFAMIQNVDFADLGKKSKLIYKNLFKAIQNDILPMKTVLLNEKYSYFLNPTMYARYYLNSADSRVPTRQSLVSDKLMVRLLETTNPEVQFQITSCSFVQNDEVDWTQDLFDYFDRLLTKRCPDALIEFNEMLRNSFVFECNLCKMMFDDGDNTIRDVTRHIRKEHCISPNWNCANCDMTMETLKLAENFWAHYCVKSV